MSLPVPDFDDLKYSEMRHGLVNDINRDPTAWSDHNIHDPGITILEMLAWKTEMQLYRFNKVIDRHRLKFLRLLGYSPAPVDPARVLLSARLDRLKGPNVYIPSGARVEAVLTGNAGIGFTINKSTWITPHELEQVVVQKDRGSSNFTQAVNTPGLYFYPFGHDGDPSTSLILGLSTAPGASKSGIPICFWYRPYTADLPPLPGPAHPPYCPDYRFLFTLGGENRKWLNEGTITQELKEIFSDFKHFLSHKAEVSSKGNKCWEITDGKRVFRIAEVNTELKVYDSLEGANALPFVKPPVELIWEYIAGETSLKWKERTPLPWVEQEDFEDLSSTVGTVIDGTLALTREGPLRLHLGPDAKPLSLTVDHFNTKMYLYWIRCRIGSGFYEDPPRVDTLTPHVISAEQYTEAFEEQLLRVSDGTFFPMDEGNGLPCQQFEVGHSPVISLKLSVDEEHQEDETCGWTEVIDFDASGPSDNHYTLDRERGIISFGDGMKGRMLPKKARVTARTCLWGGGPEGNVDTGTVWKLVEESGDKGANHLVLTNQFPASGGTSSESLDDVFLRVLRDLDRQCRAVTLADYKQLAKHTPGLRVARAKAIPYPDGTGVEVVVVPYSHLERPVPGKAFIEAVRRYLERLRLVSTHLKVSGPDYVPVKVTTSVRLKPGFDPKTLVDKVSNIIYDFLSPFTGGSDSKGWPFGRAVYLSEIYEACQGADGLECIEQLELSSSKEGIVNVGGNITIGAHQLVYAVKPAVEVVGTATKGQYLS